MRKKTSEICKEIGIFETSTLFELKTSNLHSEYPLYYTQVEHLFCMCYNGIARNICDGEEKDEKIWHKIV